MKTTIHRSSIRQPSGLATLAAASISEACQQAPLTIYNAPIASRPSGETGPPDQRNKVRGRVTGPHLVGIPPSTLLGQPG